MVKLETICFFTKVTQRDGGQGSAASNGFTSNEQHDQESLDLDLH